MTGEALRRAFEDQDELVSAMLAQRARDLARPLAADGAAAAIQVLRLLGGEGAWVLPVWAAARVEPLGRWLPLPGAPPPVLGLALLAGRRCLLADPQVVLAGAPARRPDRPGHAVLLRDGPGVQALALAVDRVDGVLWLPQPEPGNRVLADGSLLMDLGRLVAAIKRGGGAP